MIEWQMIHLVIGGVPWPSRITHATSERVGSCGAKLRNGCLKSPVAGRPTASLPVRTQFTTTPVALASVRFFRERVRQQAVGSLLRNLLERNFCESHGGFRPTSSNPGESIAKQFPMGHGLVISAF